MGFSIKRVYEPARPGDGTRVLVDRLWPRGLKKSRAHLDHWLKEVAPSAALRKWFGHRPERFAEFTNRYRADLKANPALTALRKLGRGRTVTLLYGARDPRVNHARVLLAALKARKPGPKKKK